uniref:Uncharacterized protein n=1 Tax=Anguilla anguilla TaxID=7936 RepID=A0A0E9UIM5_ANGAN
MPVVRCSRGFENHVKALSIK